jgi:hypothetical protein
MTEADQNDPNGEAPEGGLPEALSGETEARRSSRFGMEPASTEPIPPFNTTGVIPPAAFHEPKKRRTSAIILLIAATIAFATLIGVGIASYLWFEGSSAPQPEAATTPEASPPKDARDLGTMDSSAVGLKGHLTTKWDGKLGYNFVMEADDPARQAAFAMTVSNPPRPASIRIQIRNSDGVVLCTHDILLKFDPRKVAAIQEAIEERPAGKRLGGKAAEAKEGAREAELDRKVAEEAEREHGKSIFQVNTGADGKIQSISSQGEIPCPQSVYEGMGYWSFLPDFPTPEEQVNWVNRQGKVEEIAPSRRLQNP